MQHVLLSPLLAVGPVRLLATRPEVLAAMGPPQASFKKTPSALHPTDVWHDGAFQVFYRANPPEVEYIEISRSGTVEALLFGVDVLAAPAPRVLSIVGSQAGLKEEDGGCSYLSPALEISLWRENANDPVFATVGIGVRGYFSSEEA